MNLKRLFCSLAISLFSISALAEKITVVAEDDWYPYSADKGGKPEGMAVDIVRAAFKAAGVDVEFKVMPYARCMAVVKAGTEVACFDSTWAPGYDESYLKPKSQLFDAEIAIYAASTYTGKTDLKIADLEGKTVGVTNGYEYGAEFESNAKIKKDPANSDILGLKKLAAGRIEYMAVYSKVFDHLAKENKSDLEGKVKRVGTMSVDKLYLSFSKVNANASKALSLFDSGLEKIKANGEYKKIEQAWAEKLR